MKELYSYYALSKKISHLGIKNNTNSFPELEYLKIYENEVENYVQPNFTLIEGVSLNKGMPKVILVSATGATGKSALAQMLSFSIGMPVFDLATYDPVAARAVTGLIFDEFNVEEGNLLRESLYNGTGCLLIDAMDEGRVKVNENTFNAFLDDIINISKKSIGTPFILLGRNQVLEHTFLYLLEKDIESSLIQIEAFTKDQAKEFIDKRINESKFERQYQEVRDYIIDSLQTFFESTSSIKNSKSIDEYEKFIGYAPVLNAIAKLLKKEKNYKKILDDLKSEDSKGIELVIKIIESVLNREKNEKADKLVLPVLSQKYCFNSHQNREADLAYSFDEQSCRLIQKELKKKNINYSVFQNKQIDGEYNKQINSWLEEHPFRLDDKFQNIVFESYALARMLVYNGNNPIAIEYLNSKYKTSYLLFLFFNELSVEKTLNHNYLNYLYRSLKEVEKPSIKTGVSVETEMDDKDGKIKGDIEFYVDTGDRPITYNYSIELDFQDDIILGDNLGAIMVNHVGSIILRGDFVELKPPTYFSSKSILVDTKDFILNIGINQGAEDDIVIEAEKFMIDYDGKGVPSLTNYLDEERIVLIAENEVPYPFQSFLTEMEETKILQKDKEPLYRILRNILMAFRSHSKGELARFKDKIEHRRILKDSSGFQLLNKLKNTGILNLVGHMYFIDPKKLDEYLGVNYHDLKKRKLTTKIIDFIDDV